MSIQPLLIGTLGLPELLIILFIVFLIFGANKLPQLGAGLGEGIKNFKKSIKGAREELPEDEESHKGESKSKA
jgi:sec-independent protein translocase protein TatA